MLILRSSPTRKETFYVFRGMELDKYSTNFMIGEKFFLGVNSFSSTSLLPMVGETFTRINKCCIFVIEVTPEVKGFLVPDKCSMYPKEQEFIIGPRYIFEISK